MGKNEICALGRKTKQQQQQQHKTKNKPQNMSYSHLLEGAGIKYSTVLPSDFGLFQLESEIWSLSFPMMQMCAQVSEIQCSLVERSCKLQWPLGFGRVKG